MMRTLALLAMTIPLMLTLPATARGGESVAGPATTRICIGRPKVQLEGGQPAQVGDVIRAGIAEYVAGPTLEAVALQSRLTTQVAAEAQSAGCHSLLMLSLSHKRTADGATLGRAIGNFSSLGSYLPGANAVESVVAVGAIQTAADVAGATRAKDELTLEFELNELGSNQLLMKDMLRRRAKVDGEDLLTPLIEATAEQVGNFVVMRVAAAAPSKRDSE